MCCRDDYSSKLVKCRCYVPVFVVSLEDYKHLVTLADTVLFEYVSGFVA